MIVGYYLTIVFRVLNFHIGFQIYMVKNNYRWEQSNNIFKTPLNENRWDYSAEMVYYKLPIKPISSAHLFEIETCPRYNPGRMCT